MPFGSNPKTYQIAVSRENYGPILRYIPSRRVDVDYGEPPSWWSEYLIEEWKRNNHVDTVRKDARTEWQRNHDEWSALLRTWELQDFGLLGNKPGPTRPSGPIWDIWGEPAQ